jgi:hypothetical protein
MTESPRATPDQGSAELSDERIKEIAEAQGSWGASFGYTKESDFEKPFIPSHAYSFARAILATATRGEPSAEPAGYMEAFYEMAAMLGVEGAQAATPEQVYAEQVKPALERLQQRAEANEEAYLNMRDWAKMNGLDTTAYNATQPAPGAEPELPPLPLIAMEDCLPYDAIGVPGYPVSYVREYATNYAKTALAARVTATQGAPTPAQPACDRKRMELLLSDYRHALLSTDHDRYQRAGVAYAALLSMAATGIHPTPPQAQGSEENSAGAVRACRYTNKPGGACWRKGKAVELCTCHGMTDEQVDAVVAKNCPPTPAQAVERVQIGGVVLPGISGEEYDEPEFVERPGALELLQERLVRNGKDRHLAVFVEVPGTAVDAGKTGESAASSVYEVLRELYEAVSAPFPPGKQGAAAQNDWSERKAAALESARSLIESGVSAASSAMGDDGWKPMDSAPLSGEFLAAIEVRHGGGKGPILWHQHVLMIDDETGGVHHDYEQGWDLEDYAGWRPLLPSPAAASQSNKSEDKR